jgi:hypothetical protein
MKISGSILLFIKKFFGISGTICSESKLSISFASSSVKPVPTFLKVSKRCFSALRAAQRRPPNELFLIPYHNIFQQLLDQRFPSFPQHILLSI